MPRCNSCNGIITRDDVECYVCGEPVPGARRGFFSLFQRTPKPASQAFKRVFLAAPRLNVDPVIETKKS
jgi:hypothetical protein